MSEVNFKLALTGQIYDSEGLIYAFPTNVIQLGASGKYPAWVNALPLDSRFVRELVIGGGDCFSVHYGKEGLFYSYTRYNPHDARNGAVMVALHTGDKAFQDAKQLMIVLRNLMDYFLEKNRSSAIQDKDIQELTKDLSNPYFVEIPKQESTQPTKNAYRIYQTEEDLYKYLNWAIQNEYTQYKWVHFISENHKKVNINSDSYVELSSPVTKCYAIKRLDNQIDLRLSRTTYIITYKKEGFLAKEVSFQVGQPSSFIEMDSMDNTLRIKSQEELKIKFKKKVIIELVDFQTGHRIMDGDRPYYEEFEIEEGQHSKTIHLYAPGYRPKSMTVEFNTLKEAKETIPCQMQKEHSQKGHDKEKIGNKKGIIHVRKKPFLILTFILWLITISVGGGVGFYVNQLMQSEGINEQIKTIQCDRNAIQEELDEANASIKNLQDTILQRERTIQNLNNKINNLNQTRGNTSNPRGTSTPKIVSSTDAGEAALRYLNEQSEWSLYEMKQIENKKYKNIISETKAYKYLELIVSADILDNNKITKICENELGITNQDWINVINSIQKKRTGRVSDEKIRQAFKDSNSAFDSDNMQLKPNKNFSDGTIKLSALKANINKLSK